MTQPWGRLLRRDHILVVGAPGCGKTPFAAALVEGGPLADAVLCHGRADLARAARACGPARRAVYWDPTGEWAAQGLGDVLPAEALADPDALAGATLRVVVAPSDDDSAQVDEFEAVVSACRAARAHGGLVLVVDEVGDLTDAGAADVLRGLHRNGHKDGVATILCSPAWTDIPARCRSTRTRTFSFRQHAADDVATLNREHAADAPDFGTRASRWTYPAPPVAWVSPTLHP